MDAGGSYGSSRHSRFSSRTCHDVLDHDEKKMDECADEYEEMNVFSVDIWEGEPWGFLLNVMP